MNAGSSIRTSFFVDLETMGDVVKSPFSAEHYQALQSISDGLIALLKLPQPRKDIDRWTAILETVTDQLCITCLRVEVENQA